MEKFPDLMQKIISLSKRRGFIFQGSEIYGGLSNTWDYGPMGVELKNNLKKIWWKYFVQEREDVVGTDAAIFMNPRVWEASGHVGGFSDPLMDCKKCKKRLRADKLIEEYREKSEDATLPENWAGESTPPEKLLEYIKEKEIKCPDCGGNNFTDIRKFNLMFKTHQGVTEDSGSQIYLRPETAQGIFVNFKNVLQSLHLKPPFGIAQIGKAFRNEITPGNFTFRTREFEQMEIEYFVPEKLWKEKYAELEKLSWNFFLKLGLKEENLRWREHSKDELSHYSSKTCDVEYKFPWGWGELEGLAYRTDFDLKNHTKMSGQDLSFQDPTTNEKYIPHCIEPSFGADRTVLTILLDAYNEEEVNGEVRTVLKLNKDLAPIKIAILPLCKKEKLTSVARDVFGKLKSNYAIWYDETQSIGKRYRRQDEIGTPYCLTVDFDTLSDKAVTVRDRDSMEQERIKIDELEKYFEEKFN